MSHHGWTPLHVAGQHYVERILSMNSRRSRTDARKNPSFTRERSCSLCSLWLNRVQCTVQYRTISSQRKRCAMGVLGGNIKIRHTSFSKNDECAFVHTMQQSWTAVFIHRVPTYFAGPKGHHSDS